MAAISSFGSAALKWLKRMPPAIEQWLFDFMRDCGGDHRLLHVRLRPPPWQELSELLQHWSGAVMCPVKSRSLVDLEPKIRMTLVRDKKLTVDLAKYDVERTDNRGDVGEHMSARQEFHGRQMWE
jgi:hypothetical protein